MVTVRSFVTTIAADGSAFAIAIPFDPRSAFGKVRVPVVVTVNGFSYRSTIAVMGGKTFVPLRKSHREAAGIEAGDTIEVTLTHDMEERRIEPPSDFVEALQADPEGSAAWQRLSFSRQREIAEGITTAKRPETRTRRIAAAVADLVPTKSTTSR